MKRKRFSYLTLGAVLTALFLFNVSLSAVPSALQYQGSVAVEGAPFDGDGQFKFALLDSGGDALWTNDGSAGPVPTASVSVPVSNGAFSVTLGSGANPIDPEVFESSDVVLRVWFSHEAEGALELLSPDQSVQSVAYALRAAALSGDAAAALEAAATFQQASMPVYTGQSTYVLPAGGAVNQNMIALYQANRAPFSVTRTGTLPPDLAITNNVLGTAVSLDASGSFPVTLIATNNAGTIETAVTFIVDSFTFTDDEGDPGQQIDADPFGILFDGDSRTLTTYSSVGSALSGVVQYRWSKDGTPFLTTSAPTVATPAFAMGANATGMANYSVTAVFDLGTSITGPATGNLNYVRGFNITTQPAATVTRVAGQDHTATIAVTLESGYTQTVSRQWQQHVTGTTWANISGQTGNTLTVAKITDTNAAGNTTRRYRARVSSPFANTNSNENVVTVEPDFNITTNLSANVEVLASRAAALFVVAALRAEAQSDASLSYAWTTRPVGATNFASIAGETGSEILWTEVHEDQAGEYRVRVSTQYAVRDSATTTMTIRPDFTIQFSSGDTVVYQTTPVETESATLFYDVVLLGKDSAYSVDGDGNPNPTRAPVITWYKMTGGTPNPSADELITQTGPFSINVSVHESANAFDASGNIDAGGSTRFRFRSALTIDPATPTREGDYYVTVDTDFINPRTTTPVTLTVTVDP